MLNKTQFISRIFYVTHELKSPFLVDYVLGDRNQDLSLYNFFKRRIASAEMSNKPSNTVDLKSNTIQRHC